MMCGSTSRDPELTSLGAGSGESPPRKFVCTELFGKPRSS